jgi:hypothetical protein
VVDELHDDAVGLGIGNRPQAAADGLLLGRFLLLLATMPVDTLAGVVLILASHQLFPAYPDLHRGGLIMLAGGDLVMTVLAVSIVQDRGTPAATCQVTSMLTTRISPAWIAARPGRSGRNRTVSVPVRPGPAMTGSGSLVPNEPGYLSRPAVAMASVCRNRHGHAEHLEDRWTAARAQAPGHPYLQRSPEPFRALTARPVPPGSFR